MAKNIVKRTRPRHDGSINNPKSFIEAVNFIKSNPDIIYKTTGNASLFTARAYISRKSNKMVIVFKGLRNKNINVYAYACCWGKIINCHGTYIDCYTQAVTETA